MFSKARCKSFEILGGDDVDDDLDSDSLHSRSVSLESGLDNIKQEYDDRYTRLHGEFRDEKDFVIAELKRECVEKETEIERLKAIEGNYAQAKQQLKDTKWMLKVCMIVTSQIGRSHYLHLFTVMLWNWKSLVAFFNDAESFHFIPKSTYQFYERCIIEVVFIL